VAGVPKRRVLTPDDDFASSVDLIAVKNKSAIFA
jgi:hypothetical protein